MSDPIVTTAPVREEHQREALRALSFATVRVLDQAALISQASTSVAAGEVTSSAIGRLDEVTSYMPGLIAERDEYARHAYFLGAYRDLPGAYRLAMIGRYGQEDDLTEADHEALARLREQLAS